MKEEIKCDSEGIVNIGLLMISQEQAKEQYRNKMSELFKKYIEPELKEKYGIK